MDMNELKFPKKKTTSIKKYQKLCDDIFSLFTRLRDSDENGYGNCFTCNRLGHFIKMDCGHFIKRQYLPTRYDEKNCNMQCKPCNHFEQGLNEVYEKRINEKYGAETTKTLMIKKWNKSALYRFEYSLLIRHYQFKILELMQTKQFQLAPHYLKLLKEIIK